MRDKPASEHINLQEWTIAERPGYFGKLRDAVSAAWDTAYGTTGWCIAYQWKDTIVPRNTGISLYEDGYYEYLRSNPQTLDWLLSTASDVYDTAPSNVEAKFSYLIQETPANHLHDVSIRRSVLRLGKSFMGDHVMRVRWTDSEGFRLSPGKVPFHLPDYISKEPIKSYSGKPQWWDDGSIEDFYQKNKVLLVKK
ncbi:MAG TPA: hypothetical protein VK158_06200 [Acidobacteriota bacterium]|nr:hypothetical protein [Acidobacteriota bacterium]